MTLAKILTAAALISGTAFAHAQQVEFKTTMGSFTMELYPDKAPKTVANFLQYVNDGFFAGTVFHRVIPTFMVQGGGFTRDMVQKNTRPPVPIEAREALSKGLKNELGTVAMARTNDPNSATAQFFINVKDNDFLNATILPPGDPVTFNYRGQQVTAPRAQAEMATAGYTVFAKVIKGMDVVMKIKDVPTAQQGPHGDVPKEAIVIESAKVLGAVAK